jgi:hypothetical protein
MEAIFKVGALTATPLRLVFRLKSIETCKSWSVRMLVQLHRPAFWCILDSAAAPAGTLSAQAVAVSAQADVLTTAGRQHSAVQVCHSEAPLPG